MQLSWQAQSCKGSSCPLINALHCIFVSSHVLVQAAAASNPAGSLPQLRLVPVLLGRARQAAAFGAHLQSAAAFSWHQCGAVGRPHFL